MLVEAKNGTADSIYAWHAYYIDALAARFRVDDQHYFLHDANFNVTAAYDIKSTSGTYRQVVERYSYTPYGEVTVLDADFSTDSDGISDIGNQHLYTGRERDPETGLQLNRHRFYHPPLGRWLTWDPIGYRGGLNLYGYVGGMPTYYVDPLGLRDPDEDLPWPGGPRPPIGRPGISLSEDYNNWYNWKFPRRPKSPAPPPLPDENGFFIGGEAMFVGGGGGFSRVSCCKNGKLRIMWFVKLCFGFAAGGSVGGGPVRLPASQGGCSPKAYEAWFIEGSWGKWGVGGGVDVGIGGGGFTGVVEGGPTFGIETPKGVLCYYKNISDSSQNHPSCDCPKIDLLDSMPPVPQFDTDPVTGEEIRDPGLYPPVLGF